MRILDIPGTFCIRLEEYMMPNEDFKSSCTFKSTSKRKYYCYILCCKEMRNYEN